MKALSRADFCAACGCVKSALSKAEATGRVTANEKGRIPLDAGNMLFLETVRYRKIGQMTLAARTLPGWSILCAIIDGRRQPLAIYPPFMLDDFDVIEAEGAPDFRLRQEDGKIEIDGKLYEAVLVYKGTPPRWLSPGALAVLESKKPAGRKAARA